MKKSLARGIFSYLHVAAGILTILIHHDNLFSVATMEAEMAPMLLTIKLEEIERNKKYKGSLQGKGEEGFPLSEFEFSGPFDKFEKITSAGGILEAESVMGQCKLIFSIEGAPLPSDINEQYKAMMFGPISMSVGLLEHVHKVKGDTKGEFTAPLFTAEDEEEGLKPPNPGLLIEYMMRLNHL